MNATEMVAKLRLGYHMDMIDFYGVVNFFGLLSKEKINQKIEYHLKECRGCYEILGCEPPMVFSNL